jgi:hypothetical protein
MMTRMVTICLILFTSPAMACGDHAYIAIGGLIDPGQSAPVEGDGLENQVQAEYEAGFNITTDWLGTSRDSMRFYYRHVSWPQTWRDRGLDQMGVRWEVHWGQ